jgi:hypothetical protein
MSVFTRIVLSVALRAAYQCCIVKNDKSALVLCGRNSLCMGQSGHWLVPSDFKGPYLSRDPESSVVRTKRCVPRPLQVWGKGIRGAASKKVHAVLLVVAYITTQLLLPACYQELHDLSPSATGNCCWTFSDTRTPVTSVKLSAGYRVPIWFEEACFSAACFFLYKSYVNCGYARKCRTQFCRKYPGSTAPNTRGIHKLIYEESQVYLITSGRETC